MSSGAELARSWFEHSPFARHLSLALVEMHDDVAKVRLPYSTAMATAGEVVHGGAISTLVDTAAALAAWSGHDPEGAGSWGTVALSITFLAGAVGQDLLAEARVSRRGRSLTFISVTVENCDQRPIAEALVTYRLG